MVEFTGINYQIEQTPEAAILIVNLKPQQKIFARKTMIVARDDSIQIGQAIATDTLKIKLRGSRPDYWSINEIKTLKFSGFLYLSPDILGDIKHYLITPKIGIIMKCFSFIACGNNVQIDLLNSPTIKQFSEQDSCFFHLIGNGDLWVSFYGNIQEILVDDNYLVQLSYLVAFEDSLSYKIKQLEGLSSQGLHTGILGDHNIFYHFKGQGKLWIQSRHPYTFLDFCNPFIH